MKPEALHVLPAITTIEARDAEIARLRVESTTTADKSGLHVLRLALGRAARALEEGEFHALASINENVQPLVDAAIQRINRERDQRIRAEGEIAKLSAALMDAAARLGEIRADDSVEYGARKRLEPIIEALEWAAGGVE